MKFIARGFLLICLLNLAAFARADTVHLFSNSPFQTVVYTAAGGDLVVDIAAANTDTNQVALVDVGNSGIGVVGGNNDNRIEYPERMDFTFSSGPVVNLSYFVNATGPSSTSVQGPRTVDVFGVAATYLGTFSQDGSGSSDLSGLVGNQPITGFSLYGSDATNSFRVSSLTADAFNVPEPSSFAVLCSLGLVGVRRRVRKSTCNFTSSHRYANK